MHGHKLEYTIVSNTRITILRTGLAKFGRPRTYLYYIAQEGKPDDEENHLSHRQPPLISPVPIPGAPRHPKSVGLGLETPPRSAHGRLFGHFLRPQ